MLSGNESFIEENIKDESKAEGIFAYIKTNNIDINKPDRFGNNIFFQAAYAGNVALMKLLYETGLVDINFKNAFGDTILICLVAVYDSQKHAPVFDYLVNIPSIDVNATNDSGYTAGAWAERNRRYEAMHMLISKEPITSQLNIMFQIKMTCLRFALKNPPDKKMRIESNLLNINYRDIEPEGYFTSATVPSLVESFDRFTQGTNLDQNDRVVFNNVNHALKNNSAINSNDSFSAVAENQSYARKLLAIFQRREMITIHSSAESHAASIVIDGNRLYRCNKGSEKHPDYSIAIYEILNSEEINEETIFCLFKTLHPEQVLQTREIDGIKGKDQYAGNCIVASPKKAFQAMIYAEVLKQYPPDANHKKIARNLFKQWATWDRERQIQLLLAACKDVPEALAAILEIIVGSARFSNSHTKLGKAICEQLSDRSKELIIAPDFFEFLQQRSLTKYKTNNHENNYTQTEKLFTDFCQEIGVGLESQSLAEGQLLLAIAKSDSQQLKQILESPHAQMWLAFPCGRKLPCVHLAVIWGSAECLDLLLQHHPELVNQTNDTNFTALHYAIQAGKPELVEILLKHGADQSLKAGKLLQFDIAELVKAIQDPAIGERIKSALARANAVIETRPGAVLSTRPSDSAVSTVVSKSVSNRPKNSR